MLEEYSEHNKVAWRFQVSCM